MRESEFRCPSCRKPVETVTGILVDANDPEDPGAKTWVCLTCWSRFVLLLDHLNFDTRAICSTASVGGVGGPPRSTTAALENAGWFRRT